MDASLIKRVEIEERRGIAKWGKVDRSPEILLNAATEELGEVAHAVNHNEGVENISQEIAEAIGVLSRLYDMVWVKNKR
jgi:NTP pyrophosphatase (non-canonical NTP hydrolase)